MSHHIGHVNLPHPAHCPLPHPTPWHDQHHDMNSPFITHFVSPTPFTHVFQCLSAQAPACRPPPLPLPALSHVRAPLQVKLEVPQWSSFLPVPMVQSVGSSVLQKVLDLMVPRFLAQLDVDYKKWATGESRQPVGGL